MRTRPPSQPRLTPAGVGSTRRARPGRASRGAHPRGRGEHYPAPGQSPVAEGSPPRARVALAAGQHAGPVVGLTPAGAGSTTSSCWPTCRTGAHPRGRGEHRGPTRVPVRPAGSPPRARGAPDREPHRDHRRGLTPAGAGSTRPRPAPRPGGGAHPRGRGEHEELSYAASDKLGSPPRARGAPGHERLPQPRPGLTPAGAGSTGRRSPRSARRRAHPRGRGEHRDWIVNNIWTPGSPPRARGARLSVWPRRTGCGLTPAGSTCGVASSSAGGGAHPRGRGEHSAAWGRCPMTQGSPPRAREAHDVEQVRVVVAGLTPAGAGSTTATAVPPTTPRAHPRGRGEHLTVEALYVVTGGSPPRARGARPTRPPPGRRDGLTPAGAGSTRELRPGAHPAGAHPRGRGEHRPDSRSGLWTQGSPPRARGARGAGGERIHGPGLTPAGAGSTTTRPTGSSPPRAHPRGRGEHAPTARWREWRARAHPRGRGEHDDAPDREFPTEGSPPRARGARPDRSLARVAREGSPPRARGAHRRPARRGVRPGLTPAGAGSTAWTCPGSLTSWAHPRGRGEHVAATTGPVRGGILTPAGAGSTFWACSWTCTGWAHPAGAGSTVVNTPPSWPSRAHPRGRGEHRLRPPGR